MQKRRSPSGSSESNTYQGSLRQAVLVTGASGGIGGAVALVFGQSGWFVGLHYHRGKAGAETTLRKIEREGGAGACYDADIRDAQSVGRMVDAFCRDVSAPAVFVCTAGIGGSSLLLKQGVENWMDVLATNLTGMFHCLRAMAPPLL